MKEQIIAALQVQDFTTAAELATSRYPQYPDVHTQRAIEILHIIQEFKPAILDSIEDVEQLSALRFAAMMHTLNFRAKRDMPMRFQTGLPFDNMTAVRMWVFFASNQLNLHQFQELMGKTGKIKIIGTPDQFSCPACTAIHQKVYAVEDAPELPFPACTCEIGCRCSYGLVQVNY